MINLDHTVLAWTFTKPHQTGAMWSFHYFSLVASICHYLMSWEKAADAVKWKNSCTVTIIILSTLLFDKPLGCVLSRASDGKRTRYKYTIGSHSKAHTPVEVCRYAFLKAYDIKGCALRKIQKRDCNGTIMICKKIIFILLLEHFSSWRSSRR